ncbi:aromatic amino acid DMT transporter YddG [Mitsuaria sp. GD03876]|uniref:aromatic amino acid DMT transporter YddG n=1 Tax=Mitsuaria sp. GD03876 TaxID=2975399 RepID=UPI00244D6DD0|nr:aromatic amino acid DMT transporter YddG [Mitsuaria sp. GD03876]MDH0867378.1 aromatic amino acid DMT transporter YddG [Mitsuaria sp. GD03876]
MSKSEISKGATLLGLVAILFWSTSVGVNRSTIEFLGRTGAPAVLFTAAALLLLPTRTSLRELPRRYLWIGAALFVAYELCFVLALGLARTRHEAIEVGMVNYLWPSLTVLCSAIAGRKRLNALMLGGLALALAGVVTASSPPEGLSLSRFFQNAAANPMAYGLAFIGAIVWALYSTCTKFMAQGKNGLWFFMALSAVAFWICHAFNGERPPMAWSMHVGIQVALASAAVTLAYTLWNIGVLRGNIHLLGLAANATPLLSALFASVLLSAPLPPIFWVGAAMVAVGSLVAGVGSRR